MWWNNKGTLKVATNYLPDLPFTQIDYNVLYVSLSLFVENGTSGQYCTKRFDHRKTQHIICSIIV